MAWQNARLRESVAGCYHGARAEGCYHCAAQAVLTHANGLVEGVVGCYHGAKLAQTPGVRLLHDAGEDS